MMADLLFHAHLCIDRWNVAIATQVVTIAWWFSCRVLHSGYPWREGAMRLKSQRRW